MTTVAGGCLCGALRYEARGEPKYAGLCYCADCRKVSGSAFVCFLGFLPEQIVVTGATRRHNAPAANGNVAVRNFCTTCNSNVFGGGHDLEMVNVYAGSLDDFTLFKPRIAIFTRDKPDWMEVPAALKTFHTMPGSDS